MSSKAKDGPINLWNQIPPSPGPGFLTRFIEFLVNKATGLLDITKPLFPIEHEGIKNPLTLSYHAEGLKV
jgi:hypothetical protein